MPNILGVTLDRVYKIGTSAYITYQGCHKAVKKAFLVKNGKYHLCYESDPFTELLIDFDYVLNSDGTATITGWKETLGGVSSNELVVPDDPRIIL